MKKRKKTKIKRLWANEVQLVAEMQSKIDFYERFIMELAIVILKKKYMPILEGNYSDDWTGVVHNYIKAKLEEDDKHRTPNENQK